MKIMHFAIILGVILGANCYVLYRIWGMMPPNTVARTVFLVCTLVVVLSPFIAMFATRAFPMPIVSILYKVGVSWLIMLVYLFLLFLLLDLLRLTHLLPVKQVLYHNWHSLLCIGVLLSGAMIAGNWKYRNKNRVKLSITVNKSFDNNAPLKIVALSDLHLGYTIGKGELEKWIGLINAEEPDVVLFAGDIVDNIAQPLWQQNMAEEFAKIQSRYGIYAVVGNHEYISGIDKSLRFFKEAGIVLLRDSALLIDDRFYLIGRDDRSNARRKPLAELVASLDKSKPLILLDHQPYGLNESEKNGIDFQFSGHTHRGQVWPLSLLTDRIFELSHGYLRKGDSHIYVSSGMGIWGGKFRIGTQSEYVVIGLNGAK